MKEGGSETSWRRGYTFWPMAAKYKVEGEAQGDEDALKKLLKDIDQGPRSAKVVKLDQEERDLINDEKDFLVRR
ncbi:hypothetical protein CTA2_9227 [Colletotrichum tanaceti]|uniref:Acylphosphatase-like domain-containing protein n=1 Tax=Colletotrichum tanaceti TaxID=1306861 RepID=A0A4U6X5I1_9PEZI|nr:hypothetical protein CTA2_9227 [Colletotrichum tanaceti]TKW50681.1 hypothetical protein CTA1_3719 [Colletotrichum tanaceti]